MIGMSLKLFHLGAENYTQKFRISLSVSDTVVIDGGVARMHGHLLLGSGEDNSSVIGKLESTSKDAKIARHHKPFPADCSE